MTRRRRDQLVRRRRGDARAPHQIEDEARAGGFVCGLDQVDVDLRDEPVVAGEAEDVVDPVVFAPGHQSLAAEARVGPQQDAHPGPARPDLADDAGHLLDRAGAGVDVRAAQLGGQEMPPAEHV